MAHKSSRCCRYSEGFGDNRARLCFVRRVFMLLIVALMAMLGQLLLVEI